MTATTIAALALVAALPATAARAQGASATIRVLATVVDPAPAPVRAVSPRAWAAGSPATTPATLRAVLALVPAPRRTVVVTLPATWGDPGVTVHVALGDGTLLELRPGIPLALEVPRDGDARELAVRVERRAGASRNGPLAALDVVVIAQDADLTREARFALPLAP